jgi:hypothetical protein
MMSRNLIKLLIIAIAGGGALALLAGLSTGSAIRPVARLASVQASSGPRDVMSKTFASVDMTWTVSLPIVIYQPVPTVHCDNVVSNGDFEQPLPGRPWTGVANTPGVVYNDPFITNVRAHTGAQSGRVGSPTVNSYWNELLQTVQLPGNVLSVTLTYWRFLDTAETSVTTVYDVFTAGLETEQGIQIAQPQQIDNTSPGCGAWVQGSLDLPNASAYSGQRLWVLFKGTTDSNLPSSLYVDDVQLIVCALR